MNFNCFRSDVIENFFLNIMDIAGYQELILQFGQGTPGCVVKLNFFFFTLS